MLYAEYHATALTKVHRRRTLPAPGRVLRRYGDQVSADHVIAEASVPKGYHLLDLPTILGTREKNIEKTLVKELGEEVLEGEVIARKGMLLKRECVSPVAGRILDLRRGKILIEVTPEHVELEAFYPGKIVSMIPDRGAVIEVIGAVIQGVWGTGRELRGRLDCVVPDGESAMRADDITASHMGTVMIGGRTLDREALAAAVQNQVGAVIVGSITSDFEPEIEASGVSLIVTEGFGSSSMNPGVFELLLSLKEQEACFSPIVQTRWHVHRPEIVIPQLAQGDLPATGYGAQLQVGTRVRALRAPYENAFGRVVSLPVRPGRLESGARARGAEVDLDDTSRAFIPFENLEVVC